MLKISGICTNVGQFSRKNGSTQKTVDIEGLQVNLPEAIPHPTIGQTVEYSVVIRQFQGGGLSFSAVPVPSPSR